MLSDPLTILAFVALAFFGGVQSVVVAGSFMILIPSFVLLGLTPLTALVLVRLLMIASMSGASWQFFRAGVLRVGSVLPLLLGGFFGAIFGAWLAMLLPSEIFEQIMPVLLVIGVPLIFVRLRPLHSTHHLRWLLPIYGFAAGTLSTFGGTIGLITPVFLMWALAWELQAAVVHTRLAEFTINLVGTAAYLYFGAQLPWQIAVPVVLAGIAGGIVGGRITLRLRTRWLQITIATVGVLLLAKAFLF